ncbi:UDP-N-acetylenolpyruvoylglucosamine reductase [Kaistella solincola]|uniref:UDP-N-acetylenolpyruvoylglucosamine reductase n=1 Tax=Kaistella solincola TaxID=510955 RepID=A0ABR4ZTH4_9FLAO|nr:UDP-N-acetylmuramate dehydrogenase [Kaistella solincola]KIA84230.1 UDP-N-acetylenolpyruvoylglucosamine reductase [Kaistella solincola]
MKIQENYSLKNYNTFGVEVSAKYFAEVTSENELIEALQFAKKQSLRPLFLGGGSNILFTKDFEGLVIQLNLQGITEELLSDDEVLVTSKAGENWHEFVQFCLEKDYGGLENLSLIPGNVGTSPMQNIGAYGREIKDTFVTCKVLNIGILETQTFTNEECKFGYRESIFKRERKGEFVILEVTFKLTRKNHVLKTEYGAIQAELQKKQIESPTIQQVSEAVINIRQSKLPDPKILGNAGSFFKNPSITKNQFLEVQKKYPDMPNYPNADLVKIPAGWLIEQCGWKGKQIGNVASHELQALVIVNKTGKASGQEIFDFSSQIIDSVAEKFGIELEREVNIM